MRTKRFIHDNAYVNSLKPSPCPNGPMIKKDIVDFLCFFICNHWLFAANIETSIDSEWDDDPDVSIRDICLHYLTLRRLGPPESQPTPCLAWLPNGGN